MQSQEKTSAPDPVVEAYKSGVDKTLLRQNLSRSHEERLANLVAMLRFAEAIRGAAKEREVER